MKKIFSILLSVILLFSIFSVSVTAVSSSPFYNEGYYTFTLEQDAETGMHYATIEFCDKEITGNVTVPTYLGAFTVVAIADEAFEGCEYITSLTIPGSVKSIGFKAFENCKRLEKVNITAPVETIYNYAFKGCAELNEITLPSTIKYIGGFEGTFSDTAFYKNSKNWENDVLYIGTNLIKAKTTLAGSYTVKTGTTVIADSAFADSTNLTDLTISNTVKKVNDYAFDGCSELKSVVIPNSVNEIGYHAFENCTSLESLTVPFIGATLTNDEEKYVYDTEFLSYFFGGSSDMDNNDEVPESLKEVVITKDTDIPESAFNNCMYIESVTIPSTVKSIGEYAFRNCYNLKKLNIESGVTNIGKWAFESCGSLTEITIPDSVTTISEYAFAYCNSLKKITVPFIGSDIEGTTSKNFKHFFYNGVPESLKEVVITKDKRIASHAFADCKYIERITIPKTVKKIEDYAFDNCIGLKRVNITDLAAWCTIEFAGNYDQNPLEYAKNLYINGKLATDIVIPSNIKILNWFAFKNCTSLKSVVIPNGVEQIGHQTFSGCSNLKSITLPKTIKYILDYAFSGCENLTSVYYLGSQSQKSEITFNENDCIKNAKWYYNSCYRSASHSYKTTTTAATLKSDGKIVKKCSGCDISSTKVIKKIKSIKLSSTEYTYNGETKTPNVVVKDFAGNTLKKNTDYKVTYPKARENVGTYKVTVKMIGKYSGTKTLSFKINPISVSKCQIKLSTTSYAYNGKNKTPRVVVKNPSGTTLKKNTDYTITYPKKRKNVGTYKVTIEMKDNYSGTKTLTFKINPAKTKVSKLRAGKKSLKVVIAKKTKQTSGYKIQYSTSSKFKSAKSKTVKSYKTTSVTLKGLKAKKTYYVRVRTYKTVNGKKYYSGWSKSVKKKTK